MDLGLREKVAVVFAASKGLGKAAALATHRRSGRSYNLSGFRKGKMHEWK
jgi:NAD(P)-dependent dehydrogenase (short-subunit alcohol dehydrogenase family)